MLYVFNVMFLAIWLLSHDKEFNKLCRQVNECCCVFDKGEQIVQNLTDQRITEIDVRSLSVSQLFFSLWIFFPRICLQRLVW